MKVPRSCLTCGVVIKTGNRCVLHQRQFDAARNNRPNRQAYKDPAYRSFVKDDHCGICGSTNDLTKDHRIPIIKDGTNDPNNLWTLCRPCNSRKKALIQ